MLVTQTPGAAPLSHLSMGSSLLPELASIIVAYGKCLDEEMKKPFTREEIAPLLQAHKQFVVTNHDDSSHRIRRWYNENGKLFTESIVVIIDVDDDNTFKYWSNSRLIRILELDLYLVYPRYNFDAIDSDILDIGSIFYLLKARLDRMGYAGSTTVAKQHTLQFLSNIFEHYATTSRIVFLEAYLSASAMRMGLIMSEESDSYLKWSLYAPYGGKLDEARDGVSAKCHEYFAMLAEAVERME